MIFIEGIITGDALPSILYTRIMIYLIGGPPKCGKTTLANHLSKKLGIPWISSDTLEVIGMEYVWKFAPKKFDGLYPHATMKGSTNDETYSSASPRQIAKNYLKEAKATYAAIDMVSLCEITEGKETFYKIGSTVKEGSQFCEKEAKKNRMQVMNMDKDFNGQLKKALEFFARR